MTIYKKHNTGFTLIELLIVIVIISILFGLISSALFRAKKHAKKIQTMGDIRTIANAIWTYRHEYGRWPIPDTSTDVSYSDDNYKVLSYMTGNADNQNPLEISFINIDDYNTNGLGSLLDKDNNPYIINILITEDRVIVSNGFYNVWVSY